MFLFKPSVAESIVFTPCLPSVPSESRTTTSARQEPISLRLVSLQPPGTAGWTQVQLRAYLLDFIRTLDAQIT